MTEELVADYKAIKGPLMEVLRNISVYYKAIGDESGDGCPFAAFNESGALPRIGIDFVPEVARDGLAKMVQNAGITLDKGEGSGGKEAYFSFLLKGMTPEKLNALAKLIDGEVSSLKGPEFMATHQSGPWKSAFSWRHLGTPAPA